MNAPFEIPFVKMEGAGNDYVYVDLFPGRCVEPASLGDLAGLSRAISDRHYGVGGDGLILIRPSERVDARMQMFNADGSEAEMCGNGIRCVAKYLHDEGIVAKRTMTVETGAGDRVLELTVEGGRVASVRVDMGPPRFERREIPMVGPPGEVVEEPLAVDGMEIAVTALSMGNPHCVLFVPSVEQAPVDSLGPRIETHAAFPARTNVEFVEVVDHRTILQRTWERGSGETLACGTGASAAAVAAIRTGRVQTPVVNKLRGGTLTLEWSPGGAVFMTGPAREVFRGRWPIGR